jgi:hypothetical protein
MGRRDHWARPLGIACVEDKLVQRAVVMVLEQIYEVDFYDTSYGYRPGKSCHEALATLGGIIATQRVNWISDADIKGFFDNVSHAHLEALLRQRISDPKLLRLIVRFLKAVLPKRLGRFSLSVAEEKTKLIRFGRFARRDCQRCVAGAPSTFDFLGFTHYCGLSRAGRFKLKRKRSGKKLRVKLREIRLWFHHQLSTPVGEMWQVLTAKLRGHYQYYGINDNWPLLMAYRSKVRRMAKRHLSRRSQNSYVNWNDFNRFTELHPLASPTRLKDLIAMNRERLSARDK